MTNDALTAKMTSPWDAPLEPAQIPSPLHPVHHPLLDAHGVRLWCKRDDLIHPTLSGNKWRKLK